MAFGGLFGRSTTSFSDLESSTVELCRREQSAITREKNAGPKSGGDRLLTLREAAEVLRLNPRTVPEYVQRGEIIGGRWRFRRARFL